MIWFLYNNSSKNFHLLNIEPFDITLYILICIPLVFLEFLMCLMNDTQNKQTKVWDMDILVVDMSQHIGKRCTDAGYKLWCTPPISRENITLIYIQ